MWLLKMVIKLRGLSKLAPFRVRPDRVWLTTVLVGRSEAPELPNHSSPVVEFTAP